MTQEPVHSQPCALGDNLDSHEWQELSAPRLDIEAGFFFLFYFYFSLSGQPPSPFLLNYLLNSVGSQSLSPACLEQLECVWAE